MPVGELRLSPRVPPPPDPVVAVTVRVAPLPATEVIVAPARPTPLAKVKLLLVTPVTASENVTRNWTVAALVGLGSNLLMLTTVGGILSTSSVVLLVAPQ